MACLQSTLLAPCYYSLPIVSFGGTSRLYRLVNEILYSLNLSASRRTIL